MGFAGRRRGEQGAPVAGQENAQVIAYRKEVLQDISKVKAEHKSRKQRYADEITAIQKIVAEVEASLELKQRAFQSIQERISEAEKKVSEAESEYRTIAEKIIQEQNRARAELASIAAEADKRQSEAQVFVDTAKDLTSRLKTEYDVLKLNKADIELDIARLKTEAEQQYQKIVANNNTLIDSVHQIELLKINIAEYEDTLVSRRRDLLGVESVLESRRGEVNQAKGELDRLAGEIAQVAIDKAANTNRSEYLANWESNLKVQEVALAKRRAMVERREAILKEAQQQIQ